MSAVALATLRAHWEKLSIGRVRRTIAREPEDVLYIEFKDPNLPGRYQYNLNQYRRLADVPDDLRPRVRVVWRHYYGFTHDGVYFNQEDFTSMAITENAADHYHFSKFDRPQDGTHIIGRLTPGKNGKGDRLADWFIPSETLMYLFNLVYSDNRPPERELYAKLLSRGYPDYYWMIAALVFFDNVQLFVDATKEGWVHPLYDENCDMNNWNHKSGAVYWKRLWFTGHISSFVHKMSDWLNEPKWWEEFQEKTGWTQPHADIGYMGAPCSVCRREEMTLSGW